MISETIEKLRQYYPEAKCSLDFQTPIQLLVSTILSAQSTDAQVNKITPKLFEIYKTVEDFANADISKLKELIHSTGYYNSKAENIINCCKEIINRFNGEIPQTMKELITLPGVGRKTANVVLLNAFGICEGIAVDTHAKRLANRIGLSKSSQPEKIEQDLLQTIPQKYWSDMNHLFVYHGRAICNAKKPLCDQCPIKDECEKNF